MEHKNPELQQKYLLQQNLRIRQMLSLLPKDFIKAISFLCNNSQNLKPKNRQKLFRYSLSYDKRRICFNFEMNKVNFGDPKQSFVKYPDLHKAFTSQPKEINLFTSSSEAENAMQDDNDDNMLVDDDVNLQSKLTQNEASDIDPSSSSSSIQSSKILVQPTDSVNKNLTRDQFLAQGSKRTLSSSRKSTVRKKVKKEEAPSPEKIDAKNTSKIGLESDSSPAEDSELIRNLKVRNEQILQDRLQEKKKNASIVVISSDDDDDADEAPVRKRRHSSNNSLNEPNQPNPGLVSISKKPKMTRITWPKSRDKSTWEDPKCNLIFSDIAQGLETGVDPIKVINTIDLEVPDQFIYISSSNFNKHKNERLYKLIQSEYEKQGRTCKCRHKDRGFNVQKVVF